MKEKVCIACLILKSVSEFTKYRRVCKQCVNAHVKEQYHANHEEARKKINTRRITEHGKHLRQQYYLRNQSRLIEKQRQINRPQRILEQRRKKELGVSPEMFQSMWEQQSGMCGICAVSLEGKGNYALDHCHKTGKVRNLLCPKCNMGIGLFKDDPEILLSAVRYLQSHS